MYQILAVPDLIQELQSDLAETKVGNTNTNITPNRFSYVKEADEQSYGFNSILLFALISIPKAWKAFINFTTNLATIQS